jgi:hypothetical protein
MARRRPSTVGGPEEAAGRRRGTGRAAGSTKIAKHNREEWDSGVRRRGGRNEGGGLGESASGGDTRVRFSWDGARAVNGPAYFPCRAGPKHVGRLWRPNPARGSGRAGPGTTGIGPCRAWAEPKTCRAASQMGSPHCLDIYSPGVPRHHHLQLPPAAHQRAPQG